MTVSLPVIHKQRIKNLLFIIVLAVCSWTAFTYRIDQESIWIDEWFTVRSVSQPAVAQVISTVVDGENTPPAYFLLLRAWAGNKPEDLHRLRCFSALCATGSVIMVYLLGMMIATPAAGTVAAVVFLFSPYVLWYAQEARNSAFAMFLALLLVMVFYLYAKRRRSVYLLATAVLQVIGLYTHYYFVFLIPAQCAYLCLRSTRKYLLRWVAAMIPMCCLFAFWIPHMLDQMSMNRSNWLVAPTIYFPLQLLGAFSAGIFYDLRPVAAIVASALFGILFVRGIFSIRYSRRNLRCTAHWTDETVLLVLFLLIPAVAAYLISFIKPILYEGKRYLILILPLFHIVVARGVVRGGRRWAAVVAAVAIICLSGVFMHDIYTKIQKRYWKQTAHMIETRSKPDDAIYSIEYTEGGVLSYYGTGYAKIVKISDFRTFKKHLRPYKRVWFVAYTENTYEEQILNANLRLIEAKSITNSAGYTIRLVLYDCSML